MAAIPVAHDFPVVISIVAFVAIIIVAMTMFLVTFTMPVTLSEGWVRR